MVQDMEDGSLKPFLQDALLEYIPELRAMPLVIETQRLTRIIDSSDMKPAVWKELAELIFSQREDYDGFVILHGTDTMAFTASALSYMLPDFNKPIVFTGSQLPIGILRTDGKENLVTAIEIAAAKRRDRPRVPEVSVYFEYCLMRGNRVTKYSAEHFDAYRSPDYPILAEAGIDIEYQDAFIHSPSADSSPRLLSGMCSEVAVLKLFPGICKEVVEAVLKAPVKGIVMETFGAGNGPTEPWFLSLLQDAVGRGLTILNITQCLDGSVQHGRYATSAAFEELGVISGGDMSFEAGITKLMHVLARAEGDKEEIRSLLLKPLAGERGEAFWA